MNDAASLRMNEVVRKNGEMMMISVEGVEWRQEWIVYQDFRPFWMTLEAP